MSDTNKNEMRWDGADHAYQCDEWYADDWDCEDCGSHLDGEGNCPVCDYDHTGAMQ